MDEFKKRYSLEKRQGNSKQVRQKYPNKVPIYLSKGKLNRTMREYERKKFLVNQDMKLVVFINTIRKEYKLDNTQTLYIMVNDKEMVDTTLPFYILYNKYMDEDGFLYLSYYEENAFGK